MYTSSDKNTEVYKMGAFEGRERLITVMAGRSRPKDGVATACLRPAIHVLVLQKKDVDARQRRQVYAVCVKQTAVPGHDGQLESQILRRPP
jgi:hypothetical protein